MTNRQIATAIVATVAETPTGAPAGVMYAALMGEIDLETFTRIVGVLKGTGLVEERAHCLFPTAALTAAFGGHLRASS